MISLDELDYEDYVEVANVLVKEQQDEEIPILSKHKDIEWDSKLKF